MLESESSTSNFDLFFCLIIIPLCIYNTKIVFSFFNDVVTEWMHIFISVLIVVLSIHILTLCVLKLISLKKDTKYKRRNYGRIIVYSIALFIFSTTSYVFVGPLLIRPLALYSMYPVFSEIKSSACDYIINTNDYSLTGKTMLTVDEKQIGKEITHGLINKEDSVRFFEPVVLTSKIKLNVDGKIIEVGPYLDVSVLERLDNHEYIEKYIIKSKYYQDGDEKTKKSKKFRFYYILESGVNSHNLSEKLYLVITNNEEPIYDYINNKVSNAIKILKPNRS